MPTEIIFCPACNNKLRVPDTLMGQAVQCPKCGSTFAAPPPPPPLPGGAQEGGEQIADRPMPTARRPEDLGPPGFDRPQRHDEAWDYERRPLRDAGSKIVPAGIAMIAIAIIQFLVIAARLALALANPDMLRQQAKQIQAMFPGAAGGPDPVQLSIGFGIAFLILNLVVLAGGIAMVRRTMYPLAVVGACLTIVDFNECCCIVSIPVGIWALVMLFQADVKASFS